MYEGPPIDTRNMKFQAKKNKIASAACSKAFNYKQMEKYIARRNDKLDREEAKEREKQQMLYIQQENVKWAAVDKQDAIHMKKQREKQKQDFEKNLKKKEKQELYMQEEAKMEEDLSKKKKAKY